MVDHNLILNHPALSEILVTQKEIESRVAEIGDLISKDYEGREPLLVGVLKGGVIFTTDLCRAIDLPVQLDFMAVSSYGSSTTTSGVVRILKDLDADIESLSLPALRQSCLEQCRMRKTLLARNPASLVMCSLLVREEAQDDLDDLIKYVGFQIPKVWVVGYGLDVAQRFRNLKDIWSYNTEAD